MPRVSIQQFRAALADPTNSSGALRAYREITRRPRTAARMANGDWVPWGAAAAGWVEWPEAGAEQGIRFAAWGDWSGPPGAAVRA